MMVPLERQREIAIQILRGQERAQVIQSVEEEHFWETKVHEFSSDKDVFTAYLLVQLSGSLNWILEQDTSTPIAILVHLAEHENGFVALRAVNNPAFSFEKKLELWESGRYKSLLPMQLFFARNTQTPVEILTNLALVQNEFVRQSVANNTSTPIAVLVQLVEDKNDRVALEALENPAFPLEKGVELWKSGGYKLKHSLALLLARNTQTPVEILTNLAQQNSVEIRATVARNPNLAMSTISKLSRDDDLDVLRALLENEIISTEIREWLTGRVSQIWENLTNWRVHRVRNNPRSAE